MKQTLKLALLCTVAVLSLHAKKDKDSVLDAINQKVSRIRQIVADIDLKEECPNIIRASDIGTTGYVIPGPGVYCLVDDVSFNPATPGLAAITIPANNVYLDLQHHTITQTGVQPATRAINATGNNIAIVDGTLRNFSQYGIVFNAGSYSLAVDKVDILETGLTSGVVASAESIALLALGNSFSSAATMVRDLEITNSDFSYGQTNLVGASPAGLSAGLSGIYTQFTEDALFDNCQANHLFGTAVANLVVFATPNSKNIVYRNCLTNGDTVVAGRLFGFFAPSAVGMVFDNCVTSSLTSLSNSVFSWGLSGIKDVVIKDCVSFGNLYTGTSTAAGTGAFGICVIGCTNVAIEDCSSFNHTSSGDGAHGSHAIGCTNVVYRNCQAFNIVNTAGEASGFGTVRNDHPATEVSTNIVFEDCVATNIVAGPLSPFPVVTVPATGAAGFRMTNAVNSYVRNGIVSAVTATGTLGIGILVSERTAGFTHNVSVDHSYADNNSSFGIQDTSTNGTGAITSASNRYFDNWAQNNTTLNYSIPNLTGTFMETAYTTLLTSSVINPFTNVGVPSVP